MREKSENLREQAYYMTKYVVYLKNKVNICF